MMLWRVAFGSAGVEEHVQTGHGGLAGTWEILTAPRFSTGVHNGTKRRKAWPSGWGILRTDKIVGLGLFTQLVGIPINVSVHGIFCKVLLYSSLRPFGGLLWFIGSSLA